MFRTGNPTLNNAAYADTSWEDPEARGQFSPETRASAAAKAGAARHTTIQGTVNKTALTLAICVVTAVFGWNLSLTGDETVGYEMTGLGMALTFGGALVGLLVALPICFVPRIAPFMTPLYAICEGFFVGGISALYAWQMGKSESPATSMLAESDVITAGRGEAVGAIVKNLNTELVFNAVLLTFGIAGGLLGAYSFKLIRPNRLFYNVTITATLGVVLYGLVAMVASMFGSYSLASVYDPHNGGMLAIGFSLLVVGLASMNLVLDFDIINNAAKNRAPKFMEWYGAFALLVTLVWLYISLLRLLAQLQSRR